MSLRNNEPNPLAVFNMRRLDFCPPHFQSMTFERKADDRTMLDWIYENTEGRFYFATARSLKAIAAFEIHSEATYLALLLSTINGTNNELF